jgi:hypothetical protein
MENSACADNPASRKAAMRPKPDDALLALGLPRAWSYVPVMPRLDTHQAVWSIFAIDHIAADYMTRAALSMLLMDLQKRKLIASLQMHTPVSKHLLLRAKWRLTWKGTRLICRVLSERYGDAE